MHSTRVSAPSEKYPGHWLFHAPSVRLPTGWSAQIHAFLLPLPVMAVLDQCCCRHRAQRAARLLPAQRDPAPSKCTNRQRHGIGHHRGRSGHTGKNYGAISKTGVLQVAGPAQRSVQRGPCGNVIGVGFHGNFLVLRGIRSALRDVAPIGGQALFLSASSSHQV